MYVNKYKVDLVLVGPDGKRARHYIHRVEADTPKVAADQACKEALETYPASSTIMVDEIWLKVQ